MGRHMRLWWVVAAMVFVCGCGALVTVIGSREQDRQAAPEQRVQPPPATRVPDRIIGTTTAPTVPPRRKHTADPTRTATRKPSPKPKRTTSTPDPEPEEAYYSNCAELRKDHPNGVRAGEPGYRAGLDRDHDGRACEQ